MVRFFLYADAVLEYIIQMIPCMVLAVGLFFLLAPLRQRRLSRKEKYSGIHRECGLLFFFAFSAGLASLTLFPAGFWPELFRFLGTPSGWNEGFDFHLFYPTWEEIWSETVYRNLRNPFQEIYRGLTAGPWVFFLLLGNVIMFFPIGFFTSLLWEKPRWWKAIVYGFLVSLSIEIIQLFIGRSTDVDDVILNTFGALIGYWIFCLFRTLFPETQQKFQCSAKGDCSNGTRSTD